MNKNTKANNTETILQQACEALCTTVEATGGLIPGHGELAPAADPEWLDLADAYLAACAGLGREPMIAMIDQPADPLVEREDKHQHD